MYDVRRLRLLKELADRGTLAEVAAALNFSPSSVSQQLALLEREVGVPLLVPRPPGCAHARGAVPRRPRGRGAVAARAHGVRDRRAHRDRLRHRAARHLPVRGARPAAADPHPHVGGAPAGPRRGRAARARGGPPAHRDPRLRPRRGGGVPRHATAWHEGLDRARSSWTTPCGSRCRRLRDHRARRAADAAWVLEPARRVPPLGGAAVPASPASSPTSATSPRTSRCTCASWSPATPSRCSRTWCGAGVRPPGGRSRRRGIRSGGSSRPRAPPPRPGRGRRPARRAGGRRVLTAAILRRSTKGTRRRCGGSPSRRRSSDQAVGVVEEPVVSGSSSATHRSSSARSVCHTA